MGMGTGSCWVSWYGDGMPAAATAAAGILPCRRPQRTCLTRYLLAEPPSSIFFGMPQYQKPRRLILRMESPSRIVSRVLDGANKSIFR
jgi:hypothetical protein